MLMLLLFFFFYIWLRINDPFESGLIDHGTFAWRTGGNELGHFSLVQPVGPLLC